MLYHAVSSYSCLLCCVGSDVYIFGRISAVSALLASGCALSSFCLSDNRFAPDDAYVTEKLSVTRNCNQRVQNCEVVRCDSGVSKL
jgi:hypothetical protein